MGVAHLYFSLFLTGGGLRLLSKYMGNGLQNGSGLQANTVHNTCTLRSDFSLADFLNPIHNYIRKLIEVQHI